MMRPSAQQGAVTPSWQNTSWFPESTPIYDAVRAGECVHGRVKSLGCWQCCNQCNYDLHRCLACGDDLRHDWSPIGLEPGSMNPCYQPEETPVPASTRTEYPIYRSVARDMPEAARAFLTWRVQLRRLSIEINEMNRKVQEGFRRIADLRMQHAVKPGESLLRGVTKA